jgi:hypothetical protein
MARDIDIWSVQTFRLTGFLSQNLSSLELKLWQELTGQEPETTKTEPRKRSYVEQGNWADGVLEVDVKHNRIDVRLIADQTLDRPNEDFPVIGKFSQAISNFRNVLSKVFRSSIFPSVQRLAFGTTLLIPVESREVGYKKLNTFLKPNVSIDEKECSDFFYRINRPRSSAIIGSKVNRLCTWSVLLRVLSVFGMGGTGAKPLSESKNCAILLEMDVNTDETYPSVFSNPSEVFDELIKMAEEIAVKGDIK